MKYLKRIIKIVSTVFIIATAVMLIIIFITHGGEKIDNIPATLGKIIVISYLIILCATVLSLIVAVLSGIVIYIKKKGTGRLFRNILISFAIGVVMFVVVSLIKYRTFFSLDVIYTLC